MDSRDLTISPATSKGCGRRTACCDPQEGITVNFPLLISTPKTSAGGPADIPTLRLGNFACSAVVVAALAACGGGNTGSNEEASVVAGVAKSREAAMEAAGTTAAAADPAASGAVGNFFIGHTSDVVEAAETPVSLAFLNDHKAGAKGQVKNVGGKLYAGADRLRIYGQVMYGGATMPTKADAIKVAQRMRKEGFNGVRIFGVDTELAKSNTWSVTHLDQGYLNDDQTLNAGAMDLFDHFVYQLQQAGIYVQMPLHSSRIYLESKDCIDACEGIDNYMPSLIQSQKNFAMMFLNHVNPYTGKAYKNDPGVLAIEINNENSMSHRWSKGTFDEYLTNPALYPKYGVVLESLWRTWVQAKYPTAAAAATAWGATLANFAALKAPLRVDQATMSAQYYRDWSQFLGETEAAYHKDMHNYLKNTVGVTSLIMSTQSHYTTMYGREGTDILAFHSYHGPKATATGEFNPGNGRPIFTVPNKSVLMFAEPKDSGLFGVHERKAIDKPNMLTEYVARYGNQYLAEAEPLVSAYAGFQDMDAIYLTNAHNMNLNTNRDFYTGWYNNSVSAVSRVSAALSFRRGDVTAGQPFVLKQTKQNYINQTGVWKNWSLINFHFGGQARAPAWMNMYQQLVATPAEEAAVKANAPTDGVYTTTTGQMVWKGQDRITVNTPMTKTAIGLFRQKSVDLGSGVQVDIGNTMDNYAVVQLSSLAKGAVIPSGKMLLSLTGHWNVPGEYKYPRAPGSGTFSWGDDFPRIEAVPSTVRITTAMNIVVSALDATGARKASVPVVRKGAVVEFVTGPLYDTGWYLIEDAASVPANVAPNTAVTAPATAVAGTAVTISATATDSDGSIAKVEFFDGATLVGTDTTAPYAASWTPATGGTHSITSRATDNSGAETTSAPVVVTVTGGAANKAPTVGLTAPASATVGTATTLSATATDTDGTVSKVEFFDGTTLIGTDTTSPYSLTWTPTTAGAHSLTARATDNAGATATTAATSVNAVAATNKAPTASLAAPATATVGTAVTLTATATDSDGTVSKVEFFDGTTLVGTDSSSPFSLSWTPTAAGTRILTARATDNGGSATTSTAVSVTVAAPANKAPVAALSAPATGTVGTVVTLSAAASDSDGTVSKVEFFDGATLIGTDTSSPYSVAWTPATTGIHNLTARATDNAGSTTTSTAVAMSISAAANQPPTASLIAPATASLGKATSLVAVANDADGRVVNVEFLDGAGIVGSSATSPYSFNWTPKKTGNRSLTVRVIDDKGSVTTSAPVVVVVSQQVNQPPTASLSAPATATVGTAVALTATATDSDGSVAKVEFFEGAALLATDTASPFSISWTPTAVGSRSITVRATDNTGATTTSQVVTVTVSASVNKAPSVSLTAPSPVPLGETITLNASASDSDGQVAKVEFFDGTTLIGTDTSSPYTLAWKPATVGTHSLTVRATDNAGAVSTSVAFNVVVDWPATGGLLANYFANVTLAGAPAITRVEPVNVTYKAPATPGAGVAADYWSASWTGSVILPAAGTYTFQVIMDDGARISINGKVVANSWVNSGNVTYTSVAITGTAGQRIPVSISHFDNTGDSTVRLRWKSTPTGNVYWYDIPAGQLSPN